MDTNAEAKQSHHIQRLYVKENMCKAAPHTFQSKLKQTIFMK